ncbi:MAG: hypothetical protein ACRDV1_07615 [Actinomycetes bacterium]
MSVAVCRAGSALGAAALLAVAVLVTLALGPASPTGAATVRTAAHPTETGASATGASATGAVAGTSTASVTPRPTAGRLLVAPQHPNRHTAAATTGPAALTGPPMFAVVEPVRDRDGAVSAAPPAAAGRSPPASGT